MDQIIVKQDVSAAVLTCDEGISFWGGVDPQTGVVQDAHHPQHGATLAGKIVLMPTSRGSCSGSGALLELALNGHAPAALVFHEAEDILTLGAFLAARMYDRPVAVLRLSKASYDRLSTAPRASISNNVLRLDGADLPLSDLDISTVSLSPADIAMRDGQQGPAVQLAMEAIQTMGAVQGAASLTDITRGHIDGCIYGGAANLTFAETMQNMGAHVKVPTTMNAISVDFDHWQSQDVPQVFGSRASRLASAYVAMGAQPTFTCAPYLAEDKPQVGEAIGWSESNAVIYANSILGARTVKHPDYFDLFVAMTGRAPQSDVYLAQNRQARVRIAVDLPAHHDDLAWPLIGWIAGQMAPDRVPLLEGLAQSNPNEDDLKALCAAFGTTSAAPLLHIQGITPEGALPAAADAPLLRVTKDDFANAWQQLNTGPERVDLVALGSPHFSLTETRRFAELMAQQPCHPQTHTLITLGRATNAQAHSEGLVTTLEALGVQIVQDICWCSITEPVFPSEARHILTNSGKYAHYAPGLCGRSVRFASLSDCAHAAVTGQLAAQVPEWMR